MWSISSTQDLIYVNVNVGVSASISVSAVVSQWGKGKEKKKKLLLLYLHVRPATKARAVSSHHMTGSTAVTECCSDAQPRVFHT